MKTIHFNTGRLYSAHGQRITATYHDDGWVTFWDHDRHVDGAYLSLYGEEDFDAGAVMSMYNARRAPGNERSWRDGMLHGGCNATWQG